MRTYPRNSTQAAARIVALTMLADGHAAPSEGHALQRLHAARSLDVDPATLAAAMHALCDDLLAGTSHWALSCRVEPETLAQLMDEIQDPTLRNRLLQVCRQVAHADGELSDAEHALLRAAAEHWGAADASREAAHV